MSQTPSEYPLQWPGGVGRTERRGPAKFSSTLAQARSNVYKSLQLFGADTNQRIGEDQIVISSNFAGLSGKAPSDPGVAVWFLWEGEWRVIPADRYTKPEWNLQAIHHIIEAERTKMRHGGLQIVRSTLQAYKALAAPGQRHWRDVLGLRGQVNVDAIKARKRELAAKHHPDRGGDAMTLAEINAAADRALKEIQ